MLARVKQANLVVNSLELRTKKFYKIGPILEDGLRCLDASYVFFSYLPFFAKNYQK
jgi:hypothetical protein